MKILDSGDRTRFDTGAVRDMREGKGRCDLLPLDVAARLIDNSGASVYKNAVTPLYFFTFNGDIEHLRSALFTFVMEHDSWEGKVATMLLEVSKHFEEGAKKYGENNWQKGIPVKCYIDSAVRHYLKWLRGDEDEPHDRAFCWNIMCAWWTCLHKPELNDYAEAGETEK